MTNIAVTVALPAYNSRRTLEECLASLQAQTFARAQMQVVKVVSAKEHGSGYTRNAIFAGAQGKYG